jgi:hypothetical protein
MADRGEPGEASKNSISYRACRVLCKSFRDPCPCHARLFPGFSIWICGAARTEPEAASSDHASHRNRPRGNPGVSATSKNRSAARAARTDPEPIRQAEGGGRPPERKLKRGSRHFPHISQCETVCLRTGRRGGREAGRNQKHREDIEGRDPRVDAEIVMRDRHFGRIRAFWRHDDGAAENRSVGAENRPTRSVRNIR